MMVLDDGWFGKRDSDNSGLGDWWVNEKKLGCSMKELAEQVNAEIQERVDAKIAEGEQLIAEYKEAYFATGGTEEEWTQHNNKVTVTYEVKSRTDETVSFVVESAVSFAAAYQEQTYYNLDLENDRELTLQDVLGENWVETCNESIRAQMDAARSTNLQ